MSAAPSAACASTERAPYDEATNAETVDMAEHADPDKRMPLLISLVPVELASGLTPAAKEAQLEPFQAPLVQHLEALGATDINRFWITNSVSATLVAKHVPGLLCEPNVVNVLVDAPYFSIVEPPWSASEAGELECPLVGDECPAHCFDFMGIALDESAGCYRGRERVGCSTTRPAINDGAVSCRRQVATGKSYLFHSFVPIEPNFIGWEECDADSSLALCPGQL